MRIEVDMDICDRHGQCTFSAPEIFWFDADGDLEFAPSPTDDQRDAAEEAADVCPVQAITIYDM